MLKELSVKLALFSLGYLIAFDNFLRKQSMEEFYVVCKKSKEFLPLDTVEVEEYIDKNHGTAAKFFCPFCNDYHVSMIMEHRA